MTEREQIFVRPEEDIHSIIDSVQAADTDQVDVVVPSGSRILQNIVDAYLLKDAVEKSEISVRLITNDPMGPTFAERATIPFSKAEGGKAAAALEEELLEEDAQEVSPTIRAQTASVSRGSMADIRPKTTMAKKKKSSSSSKSSKKTTKSTTSSKKTAATPAGIGGVGKKKISESQFLKNYKKEKGDGGSFKDVPTSGKGGGRFKRISTGKVIAGILVLALLAAGTVFAKVLPKAEVTLFPVRDNQTFSMDVRVDQGTGEVSIENGIIPGELLTEEKTLSGEFEATGSADASDRVRGTITIYNESGESQTFVPSRFQTESGLIFRTQETISIPAGTPENPGTVEALVVADGAGAQYAIGPSRLTLPGLAGSPLADQVYGRTQTGFSAPGGSGAKVVTENDLERAYASLRADLEPQLRELRTTLPTGLAIWDEAYNEELADTSSNKQPGEAAETFTASIRMVARAVSFQEEDLSALVDTVIIDQLEEDQTILSKSKTITFAEPPVVDYEAGTIGATLQVNVDVIKKIDAESFRGAIVNKNQEQIENILNSYEGVESAQVHLWPFWVGTVPSNKDRVTVTISGM